MASGKLNAITSSHFVTLTLSQLLPSESHGLPAATPISGITADSRAVGEGFMFFAISGVKEDGAAYVPQALENGASVIVAGHGAKIPPQALSRTIFVKEPRKALAAAAKAFYAPYPSTIMAVTGTNGKTSVVSFLRQIWESCGIPAASLGTTGLVSPKGVREGNLTTPDPVTLFRTLSELKAEGVEHVAMEASSHGLDQARLEGVTLRAAGFTNLSRDHLDYHATMEAYLSAKLGLFERHLGENAPAVIFADTDYGQRVMDEVSFRGKPVFSVGEKGEFIKLTGVKVDVEGMCQHLSLIHGSKSYEVRLPLVGHFQIDNALVAAGMALSTPCDAEKVFAALEGLFGARGRLECVARTGDDVAIFVDYAHTPDAVLIACEALRPFARGRLICVLGAGGDRDPGKRPLMGKAASEGADIVIVTDDNPRSEDPALIRQAVMVGAEGAIEIAGRSEAIMEAVMMAEPGDIVLLAGKGHETGQTIMGVTYPFSDHDEAIRAVEARGA